MFTPIFQVVSSTRLIPGTSPGTEPTKWDDPTSRTMEQSMFFPKENHRNMIYDYGRTHGFSFVYLFWLWLHPTRNEFKNQHCHEPLDLVLSKNHGCQRRNCLVRLHHYFYKHDAAHEPECSHVCKWYRCQNTWICSHAEHFSETVYLKSLVHLPLLPYRYTVDCGIWKKVAC